MPGTTTRQDRIRLRVSARAKRMMERAATYSDKTLTDNITDIAIAHSEALGREQETISLTPDAGEVFPLSFRGSSPRTRYSRRLSVAWLSNKPLPGRAAVAHCSARPFDGSSPCLIRLRAKAVVVDPIEGAANGFYAHFGFRHFAGGRDRMYLLVSAGSSPAGFGE